MLFGFAVMALVIAMLLASLAHSDKELHEARMKLQQLQIERALDKALGPRPPLRPKTKDMEEKSVGQGG